jgi:flagellar hook-associated protein 1 FlgK
MTTSALMSLGVRAMAASYAQLQVTGNNISNANTPGYSRQQAVLVTAKGQYTGAGFFGKGVNVQTVTRSYDAFLTREAQSTSSVAAADQARADQLNQLQNAFPLGQSGIGYASSQFFSAMSDLASTPQDASARQVVLARAGDLVSRFNASAASLDELQNGLRMDLSTSVKTVNQLAAGIADVNQKIAATQGSGQPPNDLLDQRDELISQLSQQVAVTTVPADDGTLGVFIAGGQRLVLGNQAATLQVTADPSDPTRSAIAVNDNGTVRNLASDSLGGGIGGLLQFQNHDLEDARNQLGQLAAAMAGAVNQAQSCGLDLNTATGGPIFAYADQVAAVPFSANAKDAGGNFISSAQATIVDASKLVASDYSLQADPSNPGQYVITRMSDGNQRTINSGDVVDGFRVDVGSPAPAAGDSFLLQPLAHAANTLVRQLSDPNGIAAASPVAATMPSTNTGTATLGSIQVSDPSTPFVVSGQVSFTSAAGDYSWTATDAAGTTTSGTGTWNPPQPIAFAGVSLQLNGVPANGDTIDISKTLQPATSNGNALAMTALQDVTFVGRAADGSGGNTMTDAYAAATADIGVRVQSATSTAAISANVASSAEQAKAGQSGVSLDEEAARLIQYQQSYQAAAKVLQVAQQIFDTLLQTAAG